MHDDKKTEIITIRVSTAIKNAIEQEAVKHEWSTSKMVNKILSQWLENHNEDS